jgi:hypothetical protein
MMTRGNCFPGLMILSALFLTVSGHAFAQIETTNFTTSTALSINYVNTPVTQNIDDPSTTLLVYLNGTEISSQTWAAALTDPTVQNFITQTDGQLSGEGANFGAPQLLTNTSVLQSSVTNPPTAFTGTCQSYTADPTDVPFGSYITGPTAVVGSYVGPQTIMVGACQDTPLVLNSGQTDVDTLVTTILNIPAVTTDTYLESSTYEILATTATAAPEPGAFGLMLCAVAIGIAAARMRHSFEGK